MLMQELSLDYPISARIFRAYSWPEVLSRDIEKQVDITILVGYKYFLARGIWSVMEGFAMGTALVPGYNRLLKTCKKLYKDAYLKAVKELVLFYWSVGNEISKALGEDKTKYGESTMKKLSEDLKISKTDLYNAVGLASRYKKAEIPQLTWSHHRALLPLNEETGKKLAVKAEETGMFLKDLKDEIVKVKKKKYEDNPVKFATTRLTSILNPLSGIPDVADLKGLNIKEIDEPHLNKLKSKLKAAEAKLAALKKFVGKLKVAPRKK
jgi:hypothetical protein